MASSDEIRRLREDLDDLLRKAAQVGERLEALEHEAELVKVSPEGPGELAAPPPVEVPATPPEPLPEAVAPVAEEPPVVGAPLVEAPAEPGEIVVPPPLPKARSPRTAPKPSKPPLTERLLARMRKTAGVEPDAGWEVLLGTYWLPRIGIGLLLVGAVFFLTLALQRWGHLWTEPWRIATGYAVCFILLGLAWRLEKRYSPYAKVLYSGGFALSYFVTYATHYIEQGRIFDSPAPTLLLLGAVVLAWGAAAQWRRSRTVAVLATFFGHATVMLSSLTLETPARFAVVGLVALSAGSAFFLLRNRWYYVASLGIAGSYVNYFVWLLKSPSTNRVIDFWIVMAVLTVFLLIYALAELFSAEEMRRKKIPVWFRSAFVTLNTASYFTLGTVLVHDFDFASAHQDVFRLAYAAVLLLLALAYLRMRAGDPLYNVYMTKAVAVATLGLAARYSGNSLTAWLAVETVVLLYSARRSGLVVTRVLAFAVAIITFGHGLFTVIHGGAIAYAYQGYPGYLLEASLTVLAFLAASQLYQRTDWSKRSLQTTWFRGDMALLLWEADLLAEPPESAAGKPKPLDGLAFPYLYGAGGAVLLLAYTGQLARVEHRAAAVAIAALVLCVAAIVLRAKPYGLGSIVAAGAALVWTFHAAVDLGTVPYSSEVYPVRLVLAAAVVLSVLIASELCRRDLAVRKTPGASAFPDVGALWFGLRDEDGRTVTDFGLPHVYALTGSAIFIVSTLVLAEQGHRALPMGAASLALSVAAIAVGSLAFGLASLGCFLCATAWATSESFLAADAHWAFPVATTAALAAVALCSERRFTGLRESLVLHRASLIPHVLYGATAWVLGRVYVQRLAPLNDTAALAATALAAACLVLVLHPRALGLVASALVVWAALTWLDIEIETAPVRWTVLFWLLLALGAGMDRYFAAIGSRLRGAPFGHVLVATTWVVSLRYAYDVPPTDWTVFGWVVVGFAFLIYGLDFRSRTAVILSLASAALASLAGLARSYGEAGMDVTPLIAGFASVAAFWVVCERLHHWGETRTRFAAPPWSAGVFVALASGLLVAMLHRIPLLEDYYLTISWTLLALALFGISLGVRQRFYRYAGLLVFLLALLRVVIVDTRDLEGFYRIGAYTALGVVLLGVSFGYFKAVEFLRVRDSERGTPDR